MPPEVDRMCDCCDRRVSHHISVESMCRVIREWKRRADEAEAEVKEQARLLGAGGSREAQLLADCVDLSNRLTLLEHQSTLALAKLEQENIKLREQVLRAEAWPFDPNPFTSADHDNDHRYP
jgi:hypothetical protein